MNQPTISVITPTYNSQKTIERCLASVRRQNYPQSKIEIILIDGGSKDKTQEIVKKYKIKWITVDPSKQNVEYNKSTGIKKAKGELLLMLDHDNILPTSKTISEMVEPLTLHKEVIGVETMRYHHDKRATLLDRYFALFGVTDPLAFYLGKADRLSFLYDEFDKKYSPRDLGKYFLLTFDKKNIPTIGANGFLIRRKILQQNAHIEPGKYFPIDVNVDLIRKGFNTYAFTKGSILHLAGHGDIMFYLKRRMLFVKQYYLTDVSSKMRETRRYSVYEKEDLPKLIFFIIISTTIIVPLIDSIRGYIKIHDRAWFIHPVLCFGFVVIYGYVMLEHQLKKLK